MRPAPPVPVLARALAFGGALLPFLLLPAAGQEAQTSPEPPAAPPKSITGWSADDIIGAQVVDGTGAAIGKIDTLVFAPGEANGPFALLSVGGFAGIGDRLVAVPLSRITRGPEGILSTDMTPDEVLARPTFQPPDSPLTGALAPPPPAPAPQTAETPAAEDRS